MALTNYYTVEQQQTLGPNEWKFTIRLHPDCEVYKGHFPGQPVAPGVCQLRVVKDCLETVLGQRARFTRIKQCKFMRMIIPSEVDTMDVCLTLSEDHTLNALVQDAQNTFVKIKAEY